MTPNRQIILDTETTGLKPDLPENPDRIIEFAGLEMVNRQFTDRNLHLYIHPERNISEEAAAIHGITLQQLEDKPKFAEVARQIFDFLKGAELIIHNAPFDVSFLNAEFARIRLPNIDTVCKITDTLAMARNRYPGQKNSLDALCTRLGIDRSRRVLHGALIDCELLGGVYLAMTRGQFSLADQFDAESEKSSKGSLKNKKTPAARPTELKILRADENECRDHEAYLDALDKASGGSCLYRSAENKTQENTAE